MPSYLPEEESEAVGWGRMYAVDYYTITRVQSSDKLAESYQDTWCIR